MLKQPLGSPPGGLYIDAAFRREEARSSDPASKAAYAGSAIQASIYPAKLADGDSPIGNVMVDTRQTLAGPVGYYVLDKSISQQLTNDVVPLHIGIRISCMGDLEGQTGKRNPCLLCQLPPREWWIRGACFASGYSSV